MEARVQDFVDDKLQSATDLESLDELLFNVKQQQDLLKQQLDDARREHQHAHQAAQEHTQLIESQAHDFQGKQEDIDRRLLIVTQSDTSDDAVQKFETSMERLRKLDVATGYIELLKDVDVLRVTCVGQLGKDDDAALIPYQRLRHLQASLKPLQDAAEGAAPHLLDHIASVVQDLRKTIQKAFSDNLDKTLQKMNWPKLTNRVPMALEAEWTTNIGRLLALQKPELEARDLAQNQTDDPPALLPFEVLVHPLYQRFIFHFSGNKPTNRVDKPEYFLNHATDLIAHYSDFVQDNLQPILLRHFRRSDLAFTPAYIDSISAFITALLPMLKEKLYEVASPQPSLLSHLVQEVIQFDNTLKESYSYTPASASSDWRGLSYFLLDTCGYFDQWISAERDFALSRYKAILEAPDSGDLDYDAVPTDSTKPSKAAVRLNDLLETITERYRHLSDYDQRIRFLIDIQIQIFDTYHERLQDALNAYLTMTSTLGRTMQSATKEQIAELQGVRGLDRLCRIFGSADYLERAMRDWSDDVFFLELWAELEYRHKHRDTDLNQRGQQTSWQEIQKKLSSGLGNENSEANEVLQGALFDETAASYRRLRARSEKVLFDSITYDLNRVLAPYASVRTWASLSSSPSTSTTNNVSAELEPVLTLLQDYLSFLRKALGSKTPLRKVGRQLCHVLRDYLWQYLLSGKTTFSTNGAAQLKLDVSALCEVVDTYVGKGQAEIGMKKLIEGVGLLSLPVKGEEDSRDVNADNDDDDAWDEDKDDHHAERRDEASKTKTLSLFQAERLVFIDNESARYALEQLGFSTLSEADARSLLKQRVECRS